MVILATPIPKTEIPRGSTYTLGYPCCAARRFVASAFVDTLAQAWSILAHTSHRILSHILPSLIVSPEARV